jgi:asparagine synthase (glutamine-hydrolysing)
MCGIVGIVGQDAGIDRLAEPLKKMAHRGPDMEGAWRAPSGHCALGHKRLSIIDLSENGKQPMSDKTGRYQIVLNGEIYNYPELKKELEGTYDFRTSTDTEVLIASYKKWGFLCLDRLIGMFAFAIWDDKEHILFAARDRFGVKPFYYAIEPEKKEFLFASEIKALHALGMKREPDAVSWSAYLTYGLYDHDERTFYKDIYKLLPGHALVWDKDQTRIWKWYDVAERVKGKLDTRRDEDVIDHCRSMLEESVRLRFRSDVPVGISVSGGIDSSLLLGLVHSIQGPESSIHAFTYITGDERYDELPWAREMLKRTRHPHNICLLRPREVPALFTKVGECQDEPFGGLPTLAYAKVFERARQLGVIAILDGQGLDEQWAGYDYYEKAIHGNSLARERPYLGSVQGSRTQAVRPGCLTPEFRKLAKPIEPPLIFADALTDFQYIDLAYKKIPRALRFSDRISMMFSTELRDPFLDHRLVELAFSQPKERKIRNGIRKWLLRQVGEDLLPDGVRTAPKRPVQTPQREWLKGPLATWAESLIEGSISRCGGTWLNSKAVRKEWQMYKKGEIDNSFYIWQWLSMSLI